MNGEFVVFDQVRQFNTGSVNDFGEVQVGAVEPDRVNGVVNVIDERFGTSFGVKPYGSDAASYTHLTLPTIRLVSRLADALPCIK